MSRKIRTGDLSGLRASFERRRAWLEAASDAKQELRRLIQMRRSWRRIAQRRNTPDALVAETRAVMRQIRRWMRPWRRTVKAEHRRKHPTSGGQVP